MTDEEKKAEAIERIKKADAFLLFAIKGEDAMRNIYAPTPRLLERLTASIFRHLLEEPILLIVSYKISQKAMKIVKRKAN